ncbi:unnamed protein product [Gongylonema pulchrum]|uniref:BAR domain-containing protein n=1 Tax=Gongylonema pulchrum TaxID=637853 RepID=A0A3P7N6X5_9BILA|nr:unnamed protein product [Gongylonema pulchrum]
MQLTEETFLNAEKTELDAHFENLLQRADKTEEHTKRLLSAMERSALLKTAQAEFKIGAGERDFINGCASSTLLPIRRFLEGDMKTIQVHYYHFNSGPS